MIKIIREEPNKLIKCRLMYQGNGMWQISPTEYKNGNMATKKELTIRGDDDSLRKFLIKLKVKDTETNPASKRNISYKDMVEKAKVGTGTTIWIYNVDWKQYAGTNGILEV